MVLSLEELAAHCMEMVGYTGEGRSLAYKVVELMVAGEYQVTPKKIEEAGDHLSKAHEVQFLKLMGVQVGGGGIPYNMFLFHAMDILMTDTAGKDIIKTVVKAKTRKGKEVKERVGL